jgi:hypothetical protein
MGQPKTRLGPRASATVDGIVAYCACQTQTVYVVLVCMVRCTSVNSIHLAETCTRGVHLSPGPCCSVLPTTPTHLAFGHFLPS